MKFFGKFVAESSQLIMILLLMGAGAAMLAAPLVEQQLTATGFVFLCIPAGLLVGAVGLYGATRYVREKVSRRKARRQRKYEDWSARRRVELYNVPKWNVGRYEAPARNQSVKLRAAEGWQTHPRPNGRM